MRTGYSNFLGEYVPADSVGYGDCEDFQVVCPCCREPTYKSMRPAAGGETHYLSHYRSTMSDVSECEIRVASLSRQQLGAYNAVSRNQRLDWFLSVVPDEIYSKPLPAPIDLRPAIMSQTALSVDLCDMHRRSLGAARIEKSAMHAAIWAEKDVDLARTRSSFSALSPLERIVRSRTALDVETTLYADPSGSDAYRKIYCAAIGMMAIRCLAEMRRKQASPMDRLVYVSLGKMVAMDRPQCLAYMKRIFRTEAKDADGTSLMLVEAFARRIDGEFHAALCDIDYVALMRRRAEADRLPSVSDTIRPEDEEAPVFGM